MPHANTTGQRPDGRQLLQEVTKLLSEAPARLDGVDHESAAFALCELGVIPALVPASTLGCGTILSLGGGLV